jgi:hypothetical protein
MMSTVRPSVGQPEPAGLSDRDQPTDAVLLLEGTAQLDDPKPVVRPLHPVQDVGNVALMAVALIAERDSLVVAVPFEQDLGPPLQVQCFYSASSLPADVSRPASER